MPSIIGQPRQSAVLASSVILLLALFSFYEFRTRDQNRCSAETLHDIIPLTVSSTHEIKELNACARVTQNDLSRISHYKTFSTHSFADGKVIGSSEVAPGTELCILIVVPQYPALGPYKDVPIAGKGPDNLHLYIKSKDIRLSFPPPRPLPGQIGPEKQHANSSIIYYVETSLYHGGSYGINVDHEWSNWNWANQWIDDFEQNVIRYPTGHLVPFENKEQRIGQHHTTTTYDWISVSRQDHYPPLINVANDPAWEATRRSKICDLDYTTDRGRWYSKSKFPDLRAEWDEWDFAWDGDTCTFDYFSGQDVVDCFAGKRIHAYGDSQLRRMMKAISSGGHFCHGLFDLCQHNDGGLPWHSLQFDSEGKLVDNVEELPPRPWTNMDFEPLKPFGHDTQIYWGGVRTLAYDWRDWTHKLYNMSDHSSANANAVDVDDVFAISDHAYNHHREIRLGAKPRPQPSAPQADLVILGFGSWDSAFDGLFEDFDQGLRPFRDAILGAYPPSTPIFLRMINGYCCRHGFEDFRRYTGVRIQHMNDQIRKSFDVKGSMAADGRIVVMDPEALTGRPEVVADYPEVQTNHPRYSHVRTETQLLLNKICERDSDGKVRMRDWKSN